MMVTSVYSLVSLSLFRVLFSTRAGSRSVQSKGKEKKNELSLLISVIAFLFSRDEPIEREWN